MHYELCVMECVQSGDEVTPNSAGRGVTIIELGIDGLGNLGRQVIAANHWADQP